MADSHTYTDEYRRECPDLLKRDFTSPVPTYKLVGDITYLKTGQGWLFLSTVIDLNTRMVAGWSLSGRMTADIVVGSLEMAWRRGYVAENAKFHSEASACSLMPWMWRKLELPAFIVLDNMMGNSEIFNGVF